MKSICVFCGSSMGASTKYSDAAHDLGKLFLREEITLVYGGANVGLMKILADTVLDGGGSVVGIMPRRLVEKEVAHTSLTKMHIVESMSERKNLMVELSDAFIALPGGFGTLDEMAEVITYNQLRLNDKPTGIMNVNGYFDHLLKFFDHAVEERFLRPEHRDNLIIAEDGNTLLLLLKEYKPVQMAKWITDIKKESGTT